MRNENPSKMELPKLYQKIPEHFYIKTAFLLLCLMFSVVVYSGTMNFINVYITRIYNIEHISNYYYTIGTITIGFAIFYLGSRAYRYGYKGILNILKKDYWLGIFALLLLWSLFSTLNADHVEEAFKGHYWRMDGFRSYIIYASIFICGRIISTTKFRKYILIIFVSIATLQDSLLFIRFFTGNGSYIGAFFNENHCGYFLTMAIMILLGLMSFEKNSKIKVLWFFMYIINIMSLVLNDTFGAYLAVLVGLLFGLVLTYRKAKLMFKGIIIGLILFVLASIAMDMLTHNISDNFRVTTEDTGKILDKKQNANSAGTGRWILWKKALNYTTEKPILGFGPENLRYRYNKDGIQGERPHNEYLQYAAYFGYPGLGFYLAALLSLFVYYFFKRKENDEITTTCLMSLFGYCVSAFFGLTMFYTVSFYYMLIGMVSKKECEQYDKDDVIIPKNI